MTTLAHRRPPAARTEIPVADLAWVAGVLDLKANVIHKHNKQRNSPQLVLIVETKEFHVVRELARLTGTSPEQQAEKTAADFMRRGCSDHCPAPHVHVNERGYEWRMPAISRWTITGAGAAVVLRNVLPFMRNPRDLPEALEAMEAYAVMSGQGWGATRASLRRLQRLGWRLLPEWEEAI